MVQRSCKSSADQKIELLIFEKSSDALPADVFTDAGVNDFDWTMPDRAANDPNAISIDARFISEPAQEFRALSRQCKCNRNPCHEILCLNQNDRVTVETVNLISLLLDDLHDEVPLLGYSRGHFCSGSRLVRRSLGGGG